MFQVASALIRSDEGSTLWKVCLYMKPSFIKIRTAMQRLSTDYPEVHWNTKVDSQVLQYKERYMASAIPEDNWYFHLQVRFPLEFIAICMATSSNSLPCFQITTYLQFRFYITHDKISKYCKSTAIKMRLRLKGEEKCLILIISCIWISNIKCIYLTDSNAEVLCYSGWSD